MKIFKFRRIDENKLYFLDTKPSDTKN